MSYYPPSENGTMVNMIKQKFERHVARTEQPARLSSCEAHELRDSLRRSMSASPVKSKKSLKLNVSRQLSNPGKNIKRTPAFRGDKLSRTRNLQQSPIKDRRVVSIVNRNVKIFEEKPDHEIIDNAKIKSEENNFNDERNVGLEKDSEMRTTSRKLSRDPIETRDETSENRVRTTVISRQKNISPIYKRDDRSTTSRVNEKSEISSSRRENESQDKFLINGAEYTRVRKQSRAEKYILKARNNDKHDGFDVREELSRRIGGNDEDNETAKNGSLDVIDGVVEKKNIDKYFAINDKCDIGERVNRVRLTDTLKAALRAPLPSGPPPKKPPRTFAHGPTCEGIKITENKKKLSSSGDENYWHGHPEDSPAKSISGGSSGSSSSSGGGGNSIEEPSIIHKTGTGKMVNLEKKWPRDSKKMLEKLEHVLIEHKKALGGKATITPRERRDEANEAREKENSTTSGKNGRDICGFGVGLSRNLDESKKFRSQDSKNRKHSTFDCLPLSLNCGGAKSSLYEQIETPDFKSYFTDGWSSSPRDSKIILSRSDDSIEKSVSSLLLGNSKFYNEISPSSKRSSAVLTKEERVYAEPFAFDKNSGTDITSYGILTPEEDNYFSRSLEEERFVGSRDNSKIRQDAVLVREDKTCSKPELHYMCTSIEPALVYEDNNNVAENYSECSKIQRSAGVTKILSLIKLDDRGGKTEPEKYDKIKVEQLLSQAFGKIVMAGAETPSDSNASSDTDSLASSASISDELSSFNEKLRIFKNRENTIRPSKDELHRSLTEKRKNYVRRVSSKYSESLENTTNLVDRRNKLFHVCLLVELNLSTREPYIKDKYPVYAKTPAWIENFCFPDATDWPQSGQTSQNQFYSLALMDERGNRRYGYCYRVQPENGPILPLAYCLITKYRASGFYRKVLLELESRHGLPDKRRRCFIEELYNSPMPKPGQSLRIATTDDINRQLLSSSCSPKTTTAQAPIDKKPTNNTFLSSKFNDSSEKNPLRKIVQTGSLVCNEIPFNERTMNFTNDTDTMDNFIMRSGDPRLEERDMSQLFDAVSDKVLVILFGSLLLERKVVLLCEKLSKLSSCVEALESLLYPFTWPHTFIPVLPDITGLSEILQAPLPFVIGIFKSKNSANTEVASVQDGIVVDLDTSRIVCAMGDESSILPSRLQKKIRSALQLVSSNTKSGDGIRNFLVSEAFLRAFVETCSHYASHIVTQQDGRVIFQKDSFVKASLSKTERYFLEWFVETTMFNTFVQESIERVECSGSCERDDIKLFHQRVAEYHKGSEKSAQSKKGCSKKKTLGDRLKDLTNFHA